MLDHHERLGHLLWELSTRVAALSERAFVASELTRPSLGMLDVIASAPGAGIAEITRQVPKTQQAVSQSVARLESLGLIERRLVGSRVGLYLTAAGAKARKAGASEELAFERALENALGAAKYERLRSALLDARPAITALHERPGGSEPAEANRAPGRAAAPAKPRRARRARPGT